MRPVSPSYQDSLCSFMCSCGHCGHLCRPRRTTRHVLHACFPAQQFFCPFQSQRVVLTDDRMHTPHRKSSGFSTERFRKRMTSLSRCTSHAPISCALQSVCIQLAQLARSWQTITLSSQASRSSVKVAN